MSSQRTRAAAVCIACHSRKVKCDLELKPNNRCSTCERRKQVCCPRRTAALRESRRRAASLGPEGQLMNSPRDTAILTNGLESAPAYTPGTPLASVRTALIRQQDSSHSYVEPEKQLGYIGEQSLMAGPRLEDSPRTESAHLASVNDRLLHVSGALIPPGKVLLEAAKDSYLLHVRSRVPVIEGSDLALESLPILLQQSLCLVHALLRRPGLSSISVVPGEEHYIKVKTLLSTNHERNSITALKAMCLLHCWNMSPPDIVTLDSSWSCLGMAIRYALHIGLHKESTYARFQSPRVARRIAWYLFAHDKIQTLCWHRPPMWPSTFFDVAPLELSDFDIKDQDSMFFMYFTRLMRIYEQLIDLENKVSIQDFGRSFEILQMFVEWIKSLPPEISLYHSQRSQPFARCVHELHIFYFVGLIVFSRHHGKSLGSHAASVIQLAASTMAARLYEEIDCRDQATYLFSTHNWCLMVACVPQIGFKNTMYDENQSCTTDLRRLVAVLKQLADKWPPTRRILNLVQKEWRPESTVVENDIPDSPRRAFQIGSGDLLTRGVSSQEETMGTEARDLFPFPDFAIPRLRSLNACRVGTSMNVLGAEAPFDASIDSIYDELIFDDNHTFPFG